MKKLVLIGGGDVGRGNTSYETDAIDKKIVELTNKVNPNFLFIGLASSFSDSYYDTMKKIYKDLGCTCVYLKKKNILNNRDIVEKKISAADIIYFCGGDTIKLVNDLKEYDLVSLLKKAYDNGTIFVGMSAGAIMLSKEGYSDSLKLRDEADKYTFVEGLDFINIAICPHYSNVIGKKEELKEDLKGTDKKVYSLDNGTALISIDNNISFISSINKSNAYLVYYSKDGYEEEKLLEY